MNAIWKLGNHPSMIKIKPSVKTVQLFDFNFVNSDDISRIKVLAVLRKQSKRANIDAVFNELIKTSN